MGDEMLSLAKDKEAVELTDGPSNTGVSGPCLEHVGGRKARLGLAARECRQSRDSAASGSWAGEAREGNLLFCFYVEGMTARAEGSDSAKGVPRDHMVRMAELPPLCSQLYEGLHLALEGRRGHLEQTLVPSALCSLMRTAGV